MNNFFLGASVVDPVLQVVLKGFDERGVGDGVAEDAVIDAFADGLDDFGRRGEVHVGDPEGIEISAAVPLEGSGSTAGDWGVEIRHGLMMAKLVLHAIMESRMPMRGTLDTGD